MYKQRAQFIITLVTVLFIGSITFAYTPPKSLPPVNTEGPITIDTTGQLKEGNLSVKTFNAANGASLNDDTYINGIILGDTSPATKSSTTLAIGDKTNTTSIALEGGVSGNKLQSDDLQTTSGKLEHLCVDASGTFVSCEEVPPPDDLCVDNPNDPITTGTQTSIPNGYQQNADGTCTKIVVVPPTPPSVDTLTFVQNTVDTTNANDVSTITLKSAALQQYQYLVQWKRLDPVAKGSYVHTYTNLVTILHGDTTGTATLPVSRSYVYCSGDTCHGPGLSFNETFPSGACIKATNPVDLPVPVNLQCK